MLQNSNSSHALQNESDKGSAMQIERIRIPAINRNHRHWYVRRHVEARAIQKLRVSIDDVGLLHPVIVRPARIDSEYAFDLVAGLQRLLAEIARGQTHISAQVRVLTHAEAAAVSLAENCHQNGGFPVLERGWALNELIELRSREGLSVSNRALAQAIDRAVSTAHGIRRIGAAFPFARVEAVATRLDVPATELIPLQQAALLEIMAAPSDQTDELLEAAARALLARQGQKKAVVRAADGTEMKACTSIVEVPETPLRRIKSAVAATLLRALLRLVGALNFVVARPVPAADAHIRLRIDQRIADLQPDYAATLEAQCLLFASIARAAVRQRSEPPGGVRQSNGGWLLKLASWCRAIRGAWKSMASAGRRGVSRSDTGSS